LRTAQLRGHDHCQIGAVELIAEGPCAVAISRGGAAKTYSHTDPNEDACLFACGSGGALVAVADGHHGAGGSEIALDYLMENCAEAWTNDAPLTPDHFKQTAREALKEANTAILREAERCRIPPAPTTLSLAIARPGDDLLYHLSVGDSHIFCLREGELRDVGWAADTRDHPHFLGDSKHAELTSRLTVACERIDDLLALVLVTDGFSEQGIGFPDPQDALSRILERSLGVEPDRKAVETCRGVADAAISIQRTNRAGDNIACAVWIR
jgi:serine/threonine protein phosphatase PrpC